MTRTSLAKTIRNFAGFSMAVLLLLTTFGAVASDFTSGKIIGPELSFESQHTLNSFTARLAKRQKLNSLTLGLPRLAFFKKFMRNPEEPTVDGELRDAVKLKNKIMQNCPACELSTYEGKFITSFRIIFPNTFWIVISCDPGNVELQTPPLPFKQYEELSDFIQKNIYDVAAEADLNLLPALGTDGHTNLGVLAAFADVGHFADFILDQVNHPELGLGILGHDLLNAPPLGLQDVAQIEAFYKILNEVSAGEIKSHRLLAQSINAKVYYKSLRYGEKPGALHHQAVNLEKVDSPLLEIFDAPLEIRITAARENFKLVLLNYKLFLKRINYINQRKTFSNVRRELDKEALSLMTPSEKLSRFYIFVSEMGEDFETYRPLIYDYHVAMANLDSFVTGTFNMASPYSLIEVLRYVPDLETSEWVRRQMKNFLVSPEIPEDKKMQLKQAIEKRLGRADLHLENKQVLAEYYRDVYGRPFNFGERCGIALGSLSGH